MKKHKLDGIFLEGQPLRDVLIGQEAEQAFSDSSRMRFARRPITKHSFYDVRAANRREKVRYVMAGGKNTEILDSFADFIATSYRISKLFSSEELARDLSISRSWANVLMRSAVQEGWATAKRGPHGAYVYRVIKEPKKEELIKAGIQRNPSKRKDQTSNGEKEDDVIVFHATCGFTRSPWHLELEGVKNLFRRLFLAREKIEMLRIAMEIASELTRGEPNGTVRSNESKGSRVQEGERDQEHR